MSDTSMQRVATFYCRLGVVAGVSVLHRCCCWCQCVVTQVLLLVSVCCDTGDVAGVSVL